MMHGHSLAHPRSPPVLFPMGGKHTCHLLSSIPPQRLACRRRMWEQSNSRLPGPCKAGDREEYDTETKLRSEAEAPFRPVRLAIYYTLAFSSSLGFLINATQIIGALQDAPGAQSTFSVLQNLGIDGAFLIVLAYLIRSDLQAQEKQLVRLAREKQLGELQIRLSDNRVTRLRDLRGNCRVVIIAGNGNQILEAMKPAEDLREQLMDVATYIIQAPIFGDEGDVQAGNVSLKDLRWTGIAVGKNGWKKWFDDQMKEAGVTLERAGEKGLYVGLRMDGRVRSSGVGLPPPWARFANELPPTEGMWAGFGDGFDGKV